MDFGGKFGEAKIKVRMGVDQFLPINSVKSLKIDWLVGGLLTLDMENESIGLDDCEDVIREIASSGDPRDMEIALQGGTNLRFSFCFRSFEGGRLNLQLSSQISH